MINSDVKWSIAHFNDLSTKLFHDIVQLRINVFVVEQNCPYPELDDKDLLAHHIIAKDDKGSVVATARVLPNGVSYETPSVGRVVVHKEYRAKKLGHDLMTYTMQESLKLYPNQNIKISAQEHLRKYYEKHGFSQVSETYLEDDIPHIAMLFSV